MEVLTLHRYSRKSDEFTTTSGSAIPVNATSLHVNLLSPDNCSYISSAATETPQTGGSSLVQSLRRSQGLKCVNGSTCVDEPSMGAPACQNSFFNKGFVIPIQLDWTLEGNMLGEYFGLAMAVCAVGLLRSACLGSEGTNAKFSKEGTLSMVGKNIFAPLELLMQRSSAEAKQGRKIQKASGTAEQSSLLQKINQLQGELLEVKRLRSEDGKANERVVSIFASKEQAWKAETRKFRDDQQMLCQELQRAYLQIDALNLKLEQPRSLQEETCSECEHREGLFAELKERFGEQEFLVMATMEEAQIEQQEKNVLAERLASTESLLSQMEEKLILEAEKHALELEKHKDLLEQLQIKLKEAEVDHSQIFQDLKAAQASLSTVIHEKCCCEEHVQKMLTEITLLKRSVQGKDDIVSAMLKKAKADNEDRKELERELAAMKIKLCNSEMEKEKLRRHMESSTRSSFRTTENPRFRNSFGGRPMPNTRDMTEETQKLHDAEIRNLHSTYEEQVRMLQKRLTLYQERVADLEEDILLRMTQANRMITYKEHDGLSEHRELIDNNYLTVLKESLEAELATKQFQLSVAKTLISQLTESEAYREQEAENWKKLYLASKTAVGSHKEKEQAGAIVSKNPELPDRLELEKSRYTYKLEQRHWQVIDAFERQMKARDERMEAFRGQLVHMEDEMQRSHRQIEALKQSLVDANEEKQRLEELLQQKDRILACRRTLLGGNTNSSCEEDHQKKPCSLWEKVLVLQALPTEKKRENDESFISALTVSKSEQQDRDSKLAVVEAQLVQVHINFEKERKEKEKLLLELQKEKSALEHYFNVSLNNETKKKLPVLAYKACSALKRLSTIHEAQAQAFPGDSLTEEHVKELIEQSAQYTASYPEVSSALEETGYVSSKSRKVCVSGKSQKVVDDGFLVDKFVAEVQPCGMV